MIKATKAAAKKSTKKAAAATPRPDVYQIITDRIISALEGGLIPWQKPWNELYGMPRNYATGRAYTGINAFLLHYCGGLPFFLTFKQALELGGNIRKGAKGFQVVYFNILKKENKVTGKDDKMPILKYYTVFSVEDLEGVELNLPEVKKLDFTPSEVAEGILETWDGKPTIKHLQQRAYYSPSMDYVNMPKQDTFTSSEAYYSVLFHELTHSTGHNSRLDRPDLVASEGFGSTSYAREEQTAEMGAAFMCAAAGLNPAATEQNTVAYIQNWLERLKNDKKLVVQAASKAQRAAELMLGTATQPEEESQEQPTPAAEAMPAAATVTSEPAAILDDTDREFLAAERSWLAND